ncbi:MAG: PqqD family protein [Planctomycetes bacterium]|nr:PqqD family protein [Planctomycetota bacterium]
MTARGVTLSDRVTPAEEVLFKELEGEAVLLHLDVGRYFALDPVGTRIWALLREREGDLAAVLDGILAEFDVAREEAARDLLALLDELVAERLVRVQTPPA